MLKNSVTLVKAKIKKYFHVSLGLAYQIIELEDSGLTQQGVLTILAKNNNSKARMFEIPLASLCQVMKKRKLVAKPE